MRVKLPRKCVVGFEDPWYVVSVDGDRVPHVHELRALDSVTVQLDQVRPNESLNGGAEKCGEYEGTEQMGN